MIIKKICQNRCFERFPIYGLLYIVRYNGCFYDKETKMNRFTWKPIKVTIKKKPFPYFI